MEPGARFETTACPDVRRLVTEYMESSLSPGQARTVSTHLDACPDCRRFAAQLRSVARIARELRDDPIPDHARARLSALFDAWKAGRLPSSDEQP